MCFFALPILILYNGCISHIVFFLLYQINILCTISHILIAINYPIYNVFIFYFKRIADGKEKDFVVIFHQAWSTPSPRILPTANRRGELSIFYFANNKNVSVNLNAVDNQCILDSNVLMTTVYTRLEQKFILMFRSPCMDSFLYVLYPRDSMFFQLDMRQHIMLFRRSLYITATL